MRSFLAATLVLGHASLAAAPVSITEIMFHPVDTAGNEVIEAEWLEIYNPGPGAIDLTGWTLEGVRLTFPRRSLNADDYLVVAADATTFRARYPGVVNVITGWGGHLDNAGEELVLRDPDGLAVDRVAYGREGDWAHRRRAPLDGGVRGWTWISEADGGGKSLELLALSLSNSSGQNWSPSLQADGTPGARNSAFSQNIAPLIEEVSHLPAVPGPQDLVRVQARLTDDLGEPRGLVHHRISARNPASFKTTAMRDDGREGDEREGDGVFTALLPAHPVETVVEFYVEASDRIQSRTWPAPTDEAGTQGANLLYQVDSADPVGAESIYRLVFSVPEHEELLAIPFDGPDSQTNALLNATFIGQSGPIQETVYRCGVGLRGERVRGEAPRSLTVKLPFPVSWHGQRAFELNSQFSYNQLLGSFFYREAGLPVYESKLVQARINGLNHAAEQFSGPHAPFERHFGMYAHNQALGGGFVPHHFRKHPGGNLYSMRGDGSSWDYFPDSTDLARDYAQAGWTLEHDGDPTQAWSDLHEFMRVMTTASGPDYLAQVESVMNLDAWLHALAVSAILTNSEPCLFTGRDDHYAVYRSSDERFLLIPRDLDHILGSGSIDAIEINDLPHTVFDFAEHGETHAQLAALFAESEVVQRYEEILLDLLHGPFEESRINARIDNALHAAPPSVSTEIKRFLEARRADILNQIARPLSVSSSLEIRDGFPHTSTAEASLTGSFNPVDAAQVLVNGSPAQLTRRKGSWTMEVSGLQPGLNRLVVEATGADGEVLAATALDVYYDDGGVTSLGGLLSTDTTLEAADGPWIITSTLVVPEAVTLTISPGASLFFEPGSGIEVEPGGTLHCVGEAYRRIRLTRPPGTPGRWNGLDFGTPPGQEASTAENRIAFTDIEYGDDSGQSIRVDDARLTLDSVTWDHCVRSVLRVASPQVIVRNCSFPSVSDGEAVDGHTLIDDDYFVLRGNDFVPSPAYHDLVCFNGGRLPGPIIAIYDNVFTGATDDCLDLNNCDAHVEGNVFLDVQPRNTRDSTSNAIATDQESHITVVRNLFYDVNHALLLKNDSTCVFENNTVVRAKVAAIGFDEPNAGDIRPGKRIDLDSNIFHECASIFAFADPVPPETAPIINGHRNILPAAHHEIGIDNVDLDPFLIDLDGGPLPKNNWSLLPGSPARRTGRNEIDRGALVPQGAHPSGLPAPRTSRTTATVSVDGPGLVRYRWRLVQDGVEGSWSDENRLAVPITLTNLTEGTYRLDLLAQDSAGYWQEETEFTSSRTWQVAAGSSDSVVINEVYAVAAPEPDAVELSNRSANPIALAGWSLTDDLSEPQKAPLPAQSLAPGEFLTLTGESAPKLSATGETLYLFHGADLVDSVSWGLQVPGFSIGRTDYEGGERWDLTDPSLGRANRRAATAPVRDLAVNEWLALAEMRYASSYIELYNAHEVPASLGGLGISNDPREPLRHRLPALSFVPPRGFVLLRPGVDGELSADELPFGISPFQGWIVLADSDGSVIDQVRVSCVGPDEAEGRHPDGSRHREQFPIGTPGQPNFRPVVETTTTAIRFQTDGWSFLDRDDPAAGWTAPFFDQGSWKTGPTPIGRETTVLPVPLATDPQTDPSFDFMPGRGVYFFRRNFEFNGDPGTAALSLRTYIDDGAVFYLNGSEIFRYNMPLGPLDEGTYARSTIDNARLDGPFALPAGRLVHGINTLAVAVYQAAATSSDLVFDCNLEVVEALPGPLPPDEQARQNLLDHLRITEVMYNPPDGNDAEFIEFQNTSAETSLDLAGVRITDGVEFVFPAIDLAPGERVVVVNDLGLFRDIHGAAPRVAGQFEDDTKLSNGSEAISVSLPAPRDVQIQRFIYLDDWDDETDGFGRSLELIDPNRPLATWNESTSWIASLVIHGSPGAVNSSQSFAAWTEALGAGHGDSDGDSLSDVLEYALSLDPLKPDFRPVLENLEISSEGGFLSSFLIPAIAPPDVTLHLQSSRDFRTWTTRATRSGNGPWMGSVMSALPSSGFGRAILQLPADGGPRFSRLQVVIDSP